MNKNSIFTIIFLFAIFILYFSQNKDAISVQESAKISNKLTIKSQIEGLNIVIDEKFCGNTNKDSNQTYEMENKVGTGGFGFHNLTLQKDINSTHEFYLEKEFKYEPFEPIIIDENTLKTRVKREVLAKQNALIQQIKLKHNYASHLSMDDRYIYVLSSSRTKVYSKQKRESTDGEYLEVYDKQSLSFLKEIVINENENDSYDWDLAINDNYLYITSKNGELVYFEKNQLLNNPIRHHVPKSSEEVLNKVKIFGEYLFRFGKNGIVQIYKNHLLLSTIDTKKDRPKNYELLEDKRFDTIFDVLYMDKKLYIGNDLGVVQVYFLSPSSAAFIYLKTIGSLEYDEQYKGYFAHDILDLALYQNKYLLIGSDSEALSIYDTDKFKMLEQNKNLVPKVKKTSIYKMAVFADILIFTQGLDSPHMYAYDLKKDKLVHDFEGISKSINDFKVDNNLLYSIDDGNLYTWHVEIMAR